MTDPADPQDSRKRIEELEARVHWLEGALAAAMQVRDGAAMPAARTALASAAETLPHRPAFSRIVPTPPVKKVELMSFTDAFETLDDRLREQLEKENAGKPAAADLGLPVMLAPELIDLATAKPPPELIEVHSALEQGYPHLLQKLTAIWGAPESIGFLRKLIVDDRGSRQGFPFEVMSELLVLSAVAETRREIPVWEESV